MFTINARSIDGVLPTLIEVKGDLAMMEIAMMRTTVLVEMFGIQFRVRVAGYRKDVRALLLLAAPFFRVIEWLTCERLPARSIAHRGARQTTIVAISSLRWMVGSHGAVVVTD